uniref:Uncharacterized protein n=1 Tax=Hanusia phi TaxID=3032 RepID=A0A7S0HGV4_9CRYP|mmetsp:Transcript_25496/g.57398  ORF Transcript_25496/g.57398 Transcript_25496/m.57398 type:complete len:202 (+) Transcript_25496:3-608(+)
MASVAPNAEKILKEIDGQISSFHEKSKGSLEAIGLLFSEMASQPLPPQMICQILKMDEETVRASFEAGNPPRASREQLVEAIRTSIDPEDDVELYRKVLEKHITRFENTDKIMSALSGDLSGFHQHVGGSVEKISRFFSDLAPAPQKGEPMPEGMIHALLRIEQSAKTCSLQDFLDCFERNLDLSDTVNEIKTVLDKHMTA